ncbi:MAG TPA: OsmC family protein [bacterium]|nr:OsmC family protein [bacterium]HOH06538.1 OsmC family protein [bacterium]HOY44367.1 OsmC family protein [bacterium]HPM58456.1 OsmC family protein [bacterium]
MKASVKRIAGMSLAGKADSNHWVTMDADPAVGGQDGGARPLELLLLGLGGCTSMDVLSILEKKRIHLDDYECLLEADRADEHPKVFTRIRIKFVFYGDAIPAEAVERAIALSEEKYCSASAMLRKSAEVQVEYEIRPGRPTQAG